MRPVLFSLLLLCAAASLPAQAPGDSVRLTLHAGDVVVGSFLERDTELWRLAFPQADPRLIPRRDVRRAERQIIRTRSQLRSQSMAIGMLLGCGAMYAVYATEIKSDEDSLGNLLILPLGAVGVLGGGVFGYAVGSTRPEVVWRELR